MITASEARQQFDVSLQQTKDAVDAEVVTFCESLAPLIEEANNNHIHFIVTEVPDNIRKRDVWMFMDTLGYTVSGIKNTNERKLRISW